LCLNTLYQNYNLTKDSAIITWICQDESTFLFDFLYDKCNLSKKTVQTAMKNRNIKLNNKRIRKNKTIMKGDIISLNLLFESKVTVPQNFMKLEIIYEDEHILAISKPSNINMYPSSKVTSNTLANQISYYFECNNIPFKVRFINRLDRDTSGIVLIAKNPYAHQQYSKQFDNNTIEKYYLCICEGNHNYTKGSFTSSLESKEKLKKCITNYKLISKNNNLSFFKVKLITGRTHQIRKHFSENNIPLLGDSLYNIDSNLIVDRQMLHAYKCSFKNIVTLENIEIISEIPNDFKKNLKMNCLDTSNFVVL